MLAILIHAVNLKLFHIYLTLTYELVSEESKVEKYESIEYVCLVCAIYSQVPNGWRNGRGYEQTDLDEMGEMWSFATSECSDGLGDT